MVENDRVQSGYEIVDGSVNHLKLFRFLPYGPFNSTVVEGIIEDFINADPGAALCRHRQDTRSSPSRYPSEASFAGVLGYPNTHTTHLTSRLRLVVSQYFRFSCARIPSFSIWVGSSQNTMAGK